MAGDVCPRSWLAAASASRSRLAGGDLRYRSIWWSWGSAQWQLLCVQPRTLLFYCPSSTHADYYVVDGGLLRAVHDLGTCGGVRWKSSNSLIFANIVYHAGNASAAVSGRCATGTKLPAALTTTHVSRDASISAMHHASRPTALRHSVSCAER